MLPAQQTVPVHSDRLFFSAWDPELRLLAGTPLLRWRFAFPHDINLWSYSDSWKTPPRQWIHDPDLNPDSRTCYTWYQRWGSRQLTDEINQWDYQRQWIENYMTVLSLSCNGILKIPYKLQVTDVRPLLFMLKSPKIRQSSGELDQSNLDYACRFSLKTGSGVYGILVYNNLQPFPSQLCLLWACCRPCGGVFSNS